MCPRTARGLIATFSGTTSIASMVVCIVKMINYFTLEWSCYAYVSELYIFVTTNCVYTVRPVIKQPCTTLKVDMLTHTPSTMRSQEHLATVLSYYY